MLSGQWLPDGMSFLSGLPTGARKRRQLMPVQVFADESGGKGQSRHFVMAGLVAESESWAEFSDKWSVALAAPHPRTGRPLRRFKMQHAAALAGEFHGWTERERDDKLVELARIINGHAKYVTTSVIDLEAHAKLFARRVEKPLNEPYFWPFQNTILATAFTLQDIGWRDRFEAIFDENVIFGTRAKAWYPVIRESARFREPETYPLLPVDPIFRTDDEFLPLQACDMFAWCFRVGTDIGPGDRDRPFEWLLGELMSVTRCDYTQYYDEERLTSVIEMSQQHQRELASGQHQELFDTLTEKYRELWGRNYRRRRRDGR